MRCFSFQFYIKPQLECRPYTEAPRCFSFQFYIKPQHPKGDIRLHKVVSHSNSTSNHNRLAGRLAFVAVVSHSNSTSNHNASQYLPFRKTVVSHSNSTSNHNTKCVYEAFCPLFLIPILHQTTTLHGELLPAAELFLIPILHQTTTALFTSCCVTGCFSFQFYIKPQPNWIRLFANIVVSHSNSTSNHNSMNVTAPGGGVVSHSNSTSNHNYQRHV